jgi:phage baseplate assembly protein gpV
MAKLVCTVELSKETGISIKVENAEGGITQTITMDGTTLTLKVAGQTDTSTFTQKADSIAIKCKTFSIDADDTITCTSKKATKHHSDDTLTLESTKDLTLTSSAKLVQSAVSDLTLAGANVKATAQSAASLKGLTTEIAGDQSLALKATQVNLSGAQVAIKADAQLGAESSGVATLGGSMTTIKGTLINAG